MRSRVCPILLTAFALTVTPATSIAQALSAEARVCANLHQQQQYDKAFPRCLKAANEGDASAQLSLAELYEHGWGVKKDMISAHAWYLRAAKLGSSNGQYRVAQMYRDGIGVAMDKSRAKLWFEQAKKSGRKSK